MCQIRFGINQYVTRWFQRLMCIPRSDGERSPRLCLNSHSVGFFQWKITFLNSWRYFCTNGRSGGCTQFNSQLLIDIWCLANVAVQSLRKNENIIFLNKKNHSTLKTVHARRVNGLLCVFWYPWISINDLQAVLLDKGKRFSMPL